ncbi:hypothetical protein FACS1894208_01220 [Clostridia bacterium]|nr:hypothetical protein FACS1894208_01220 [Clostridia bacterium]
MTLIIFEREYYLLLNGYALMELNERYGGTDKLMQMLCAHTSECIAALFDMFVTLCEHGELARRYLGYEHAPIPQTSEIIERATLDDTFTLRNAVIETIGRGFTREITDENEEIDIGLAELNKSKDNKIRRANYVRIGVVLGLSIRETMLETPGALLDLLELKVRERGKTTKEA